MDVNLSKFQELVMEGRPGVLRFMGSQGVGHDWVTELNWTDAKLKIYIYEVYLFSEMLNTVIQWNLKAFWNALQKEMATHSSILAWRIPWMEELGGLQSTGHKQSDMTERLNWTELIYNIVLVSGVQHGDTVTNIHIFIFFRFFPQTGIYIHEG